MSIEFTNIADLIDPEDSQGRTYRQINAEKQHTIPVATLVEIKDTGVRLFVARQGRDCDQEPLYWLTPNPDHVIYPKEMQDWESRTWYGGFSESSLTVIKSAEDVVREGIESD